MQAFVRDLSPGSRRNRFFRTLHELPQPLLEALTRIDYRTHMALVAEVCDGGAGTVVAEGRYVIDAGGGSAEVALTVGDGWQGLGLGGLLLARLVAHARAQGLRRLHGQVLPANRAMAALARKSGFTIGRDPSDPGILRIERALQGAPASTRPLQAA
ncbi:GNAT family N-acetyltransferase [Salinarimonas soli]|uniref:GNAT family N-acetyltransferase n=1 Tax=Salinarimonas soli TaxID=1638099 RepID=A0A5B2VH77_9HYPH|nr:GNAT family N-acetyltransferase [Salinarimonas soli]KAA2238244.1 GNAT family N-acetyltransferase [Salinarimonas soli]